MCNNNDNCKCISEILTVISILQQNANCCSDACLDTCDRGFLGSSCPVFGYNTRPIMLYMCGSTSEPLAMPTSREDVTGEVTSTVFRIEKIDGCCATFRVLAPNTDTTEQANIPYVSTNSFFTVNLNCVCCLRCLPDTLVECL